MQRSGPSGYKNVLPQRSHVSEIIFFREKIDISGNN